MKADPYANYKIRTQKVDRGYLCQEEIETIMKKKFSTKRLDYARITDSKISHDMNLFAEKVRGMEDKLVVNQ